MNEEKLVPKGIIQVEKTGPDSIEAEDFSYEGYQVVRAEFFAHLFEPSVTFNKETVAVNAACLRKLPENEYVQFLVNPTEKKLAVKPCRYSLQKSWISWDGIPNTVIRSWES